MKRLVTAATLALGMFGLAWADPGPDPLPERYVALEQNAVVPKQAIINGMFPIDRDSLYLITTRGDYVLDVLERCDVASTPVAIIGTPGVGIDTRSRVRARGRLCRIEVITKVERAHG